jgi:hypothetical protein
MTYFMRDKGSLNVKKLLSKYERLRLARYPITKARFT